MRGEHLLRQRHADGVGQALAERAGRGLDAQVRLVLGVAGGVRAELAERLQVARSSADSRSDAAASTAASSRGRSRARSGRGPAIADCRDCACRWSLHRTSAMSAMPIGMPGCPELAFWTASIARARMALASCRRCDDLTFGRLEGRHSGSFRAAALEGRAFWTRSDGPGSGTDARRDQVAACDWRPARSRQ